MFFVNRISTQRRVLNADFLKYFTKIGHLTDVPSVRFFSLFISRSKFFEETL